MLQLAGHPQVGLQYEPGIQDMAKALRSLSRQTSRLNHQTYAQVDVRDLNQIGRSNA